MNSLEAGLRAMTNKSPGLRVVFDALASANICYGLYAGSHVAALTKNRAPTDVDLLVHDDDFDRLPDLFPHARIEHRGIGDFAYLGNDVEVMSRADVLERYPFRLTPKAVEKITVHDGISVVDPVDTLILKSILQRNADVGKHDIEDMQAVLATVDIDTDYLGERLRETEAVDATREVWARFGIAV